MVNRKEWSKVTRIHGEGGGVHLYVKGSVLEKALKSAGVPVNSRDLVMRASYMVGSISGSARILIELRCVEWVMKGVVDLNEEEVIRDADIKRDGS